MAIVNYWSPKLFSKLSSFLFMLLVILTIGTSGFYFIEGWGLVDSFYMTVITISTVGFGEVEALSTSGKLFTAALIVGSFGTFAYAITSITNYLVGGEYKRLVKERKMKSQLMELNNHVIICGYGRVGRQAAEDLISVGTDVVVIEMNDTLAEDHAGVKNLHFLTGDATVDTILPEANIANAKAVITCLPKDADNVYVVLSARESKSDVLILSRANSISAVSKLKSAGANNVILPDTIGGSHLASLIANPDVMEFLDILRVQGADGANVNSVSFSELPEDMQGLTIGQLEANKISGVTVIGFKTAGGEYIVNPDENLKMIPDSKLFVLGSIEQIKLLKKHFGLNH